MIGYHATVVGDVRIGQRAYIAAGAIVTRDVKQVEGWNDGAQLKPFRRRPMVGLD